jgi:CysZ protein
MLDAALRSIRDVLSSDFRHILWKAIGLTLILFVAIFVGVETLLSLFAGFPWPWLTTVLSIITGLGLIAAFFFVMAPVTAMFAGIFLDQVAERIERRDYPQDPVGKPLPLGTAIIMGIQFALLVLVVNLATLPTFFLGIGAAAMVIANAYLLGREYFTMVAARHMGFGEAADLRRDNAARVFAAGLIPAGLAVIPLVNVLVPIFSTAYFVHIFKMIAADERVVPANETAWAFRPARLADIAAVQDQPMMGMALALRRHHGVEHLLDLGRGLAGSEAGPVADPEQMGVDGDGRLAEGGVEDDIGGLAADAGQRLEGGAIARNLPAMPLDQHLRERDHVLGLGAVEPDRADMVAERRLAQRDHLLRRVDLGKKPCG